MTNIYTEPLHVGIESRYPDPLDCAVGNELAAILADKLKKLPKQQALIVKEYLWGLKSYREIGKEQGCSHEYVRKMKDKGLDSLRESLGFLAGEIKCCETSKRALPVTKKQVNRLSPEQHAAMTPLQKKERQRQLSHKWYLKNRDHLLLENKHEYREDRVYWDWRSKKWQQKHPESLRAYQRQYHKQRSEDLGDATVAERIIAGTDLTKQDIPYKLIELKRKELILHRIIAKKGNLS